MKMDFNPRSREGSDSKGFRDFVLSDQNFNPRSREGSDERVLVTFKNDHDISIHAPAKGATMPDDSEVADGIFQSTLPRRERP